MLVSAVTGEGIGDLSAAIEARLGGADEIMELTVPAAAGKLTHWLHENVEVLERTPQDSGDTRYRIRVDATRKARLAAQMKAL